MALVRNDALLYLSSLTVADTPGEKLKVDIQNKLVSRVNRALGAETIKHAYFVEFVVQ
jgi:flagellar basal body-associated protein FliL